MIFYTCIIALCFAIYYNFINYTDYPKSYIIDKYNHLMNFNYELQINALMNNTELKKDMKIVLKSIFLFSAYLDFDAFVEEKNLFKRNNERYHNEVNKLTELNQLVNHSNITENYIKYNISQNYYRDIYFNTFNLMNMNKLQFIVNDLFLKNIFETNEKFFKSLNKQLLIMNINRDDLLSKKILDKIYSNVLHDSDFYRNLIQLETFIRNMETLNDLDKSYYCVQLEKVNKKLAEKQNENDLCPDHLDLFIKENYFLNEMNDSKKYSKYTNAYSNKCCNYY